MELESRVTVVEGEIFNDERGRISSLNNFHFEGVRRSYFITHPDVSVVRGWHGHQFERKWFYCVKGAFTLALVKVDNWKTPSHDLPAEIYSLSEHESRLVCVPGGYANCLKASEEESVMIVLSDKILSEALEDSWRYDKNMWVDWSKY